MITKETSINEQGNLYRSRIVEVKPHIGRRRPIISLPKDLTEYRRMGAAEQTEEEKDFVSKNVSAGRIILMPEKEKEFQQIEARARNLCKRSLLVQDYMLHETYEGVAKTFNEERERYLAKRDEIDQLWDESVTEFSRGLLDFIASCGVPHEDVVTWHKRLMSQLPSHEEWRHSFFFRLEAREFPAEPGVLPGMDKEWREYTRELARSLMANQVVSLFEQAAKVMKKIPSGKPVAKTANVLMNMVRNIQNTNMIQQDAILNVTKKFLDLKDLNPDQESDEYSDKIEFCTGHLIMLADEYKIDLPMSALPNSVDREYLLGRALQK